MTNESVSKSKLIPISYYDPSKETRLSAYADTVVYERDGYFCILRAIRFGGYPEMVHALTDAIYAGATIDAQMEGENFRLKAEVKRYERQVTHDGVYAEATLLCRDGEQNAKTSGDSGEAEDSESQDGSNLPPRKCVIFCPAGDRERLFEELDRKTSVPLIPAFRDYVLDELERRGDLKRITVVSIREKIDAWILRCSHEDANIISVVEEGLRNGTIAIPGTATNPDGFANIGNVTGYLNAFGVTVAERIREQFTPLFDPANEPLSPEILSVNGYIREHAGYPLYDAQLAVAESVKRQLDHDKCAFIVAECGSGKTKIGAAAMAAFWDLKAGRARRTAKTFNIILCPSHVAKKWVREIAETLPNSAAMIVRSITELNGLYGHYQEGDKSVYAVISKEKARDGYMKRPAVLWKRSKKAYVCPDCLKPVEMPVTEDRGGYMEPVKQFFFRTENRKNHKCRCCGSLLWTAVNPCETSDWVKIGNYGWVDRNRVEEHFKKTKNEAVLQRLREIAEHPEARFPVVGACRRFPLSSYIKRRYKGKLDGLIVDELHEYNNDSGQGDAMGEIFAAAKKAIGMTATLINGYASGIFHLLFRTMPACMLQDGKRHCAPSEFNAEYGVVETSYEETDADYASNRRNSKSKSRTKQLPGVSPLVYSRFLLEKTAFLSLSDMGKDLPDYEEIPVALNMSAEAMEEYRRVEGILVNFLKSDRKIAQKILSTYLNLLTVYPDQPYEQPPVFHPLSGKPIVLPEDCGDADTVGEKEQAVLDIVRRKVEAGERVLVYTSWVRSDSQRKLLKLLTQNGYHAEIMSDKITPDAREEWVFKRLASGMQVLITNPSLVETGLDLNAFTTLIFFSMGYKLFTLRQASRRSWRINQTAPKVEVYMLYYRDTMQQKAMKLMASKLAVAGIIEGNFTEEGLAAMSDVKDMTSQMAKELMMGIKDNVEDIAASFKKMAIVNPGHKEQPEANALPAPEGSESPSSGLVEIPQSVIDALMAEPDTTPESVFEMTPTPVETAVPSEAESVFETAENDTPETPKTAAPKKRKAQNTKPSENAAQIAAVLELEIKNRKPKRRKKEEVDENQLSLFDFAA